MNGLADLQQRFQHSLLTGDADPVRGQVPGQGLAVYCHAYRSRLREVLACDYPALRNAMGPDIFDDLADAYIHTHPSRHTSLRYFGQHLASFLETHPNTQDTPAWAELARFEWTLGEAFDAPDQALATETDLAALAPADWPALRLVFHASVHRLDLGWNTMALWRAHEDEGPPVEAQESPQPVPWIIWRRDLVTRFRSLAEDEQVLLDAARRGECFAEACEQLSTVMAPEAVPLQAASFLKSWINDGLIHTLA